MKRITKAEAARREAIRREAVRAEKARKASVAERYMLTRINTWAVLMMVVMPLLVDVALRAVNVWLDTYIAVYYESTAITVLQWVVYYLVLILTTVYQFGGFAVLGYSVMRYNVKKSVVPILLSVVSATVNYGAGIVEIIYTQGINTVKNNLAYVLPYWILNYFLALFTTLCIIFLCAMLRLAFLRHGRMQVHISEESREEKKKNVLRRLYLWMTGLLFLFNFVPGVMNMVMELSEAGAPEDIWDFITLIQPLVEIILLNALGYFTMLKVGTILTEQNEEQLARAEATVPTPAPTSVPPMPSTEETSDGK